MCDAEGLDYNPVYAMASVAYSFYVHALPKIDKTSSCTVFYACQTSR